MAYSFTILPADFHTRTEQKNTIMNLLPYENTEINSPLSKEEIKAVLESNLDWTDGFEVMYIKYSSKEYEGYVNEDTFSLRRVLKHGRNSFIPIVTGTISRNTDGSSRIELKIRLHKFVSRFLIGVTLFSLLLFLAPMLGSSSTKESQKEHLMEFSTIDEALAEKIVNNSDGKPKPVPLNWNFLYFLTIPYFLSTLLFNNEAIKVKRKLNSILKANNRNTIDT